MPIQAFTDEERFAQAMGDLAFFQFGTLGWIRERGLDLDDYCRYLGESAASAWPSDMTATTIASYIALNVSSCGVMTATAEGDDSEARVRITGPDEETLSDTCADRSDVGRQIEVVFGTILERLGHTISVQATGDALVATIRPT